MLLGWWRLGMKEENFFTLSFQLQFMCIRVKNKKKIKLKIENKVKGDENNIIDSAFHVC